MNRPRMSIVVPSFQQGTYLRRTLLSLTGQAGLKPGELEIIVIDGGSTDGSVDILREFAPHFSYWISEPDKGQTHALRKGFEQARGDIQGWLCSDDLLEPDTVREAIDFFDRTPDASFCYGDALWIDAEDRVLRAKKEIPFNWFIFKYDHDYIPQPSSFWRRDLYQAVGGLDESFDLAMDADLFARFAEKSRPVHVRNCWSRLRSYPQQKTLRLRQKGLDEMRHVCRRHGARLENRALQLAAHTLAKGLRVGLKFVNGCYW